MTGAVIPNNADAVIMKEMVDVKDDVVSFPNFIQKNQNIRNIGEDIKKGDTVIKKGRQNKLCGSRDIIISRHSENRCFQKTSCELFFLLVMNLFQ